MTLSWKRAVAALVSAAPLLGGAVAQAAPGVALVPGYSEGTHLGQTTTVHAAVSITGSEYFGGPEPLTGATLSLPAGTAVSNAGFPTCEEATLKFIGPSGCPSGSAAGRVGAVLLIVSFGTERVPEEATVEPFFAPGGGLFFYVEGHSPVSFEMIAPAHYEAASPPFGPRVAIELPLAETVPGAPFASITELDVDLGASRSEGGGETGSVKATEACPEAGLGWRLDARFGDANKPLPEASGAAEALTACPSPSATRAAETPAPAPAPAPGPVATTSSAVPAPVLGHSASVQPVSGEVLVELPGTHTFVRLSALSSVPLGTIVDTTRGTVQLTSAVDAAGHTQSGRFYSGIFQVTQTKARSPLRGTHTVELTVLSLAGEAPQGCRPVKGRHARGSRRHAARRLWGDAHGNFRTQGRYAAATVRGTKWLTEDTCAGTLVRVTRGVVSVENLRSRRSVLVHAGKSVLER